MLEKLIQKFYLPILKKVEAKIGYKLKFRHIPERYINGWVSCDMTRTWKDFGLDIKSGANYFTMGHIVKGDSSRFNKDSPEYQSWLGGYTLKLSSQRLWSLRDHFKLAIADQNNWLRWYGDQHPMTSIDGWRFNSMGQIKVDKYNGQLYEFGCTTHSDTGKSHTPLKLYFASLVMTALFKLSNPKLDLKPEVLRPDLTKSTYKKIRLKGYIAIFDIKNNVKIVFYGNGAIIHKEDSDTNTFEILKDDLLNAIKSCDIIAV